MTRVLVLSGLFPPAVRGGGLIRSVDSLVAPDRPGVDVRVLTTNADLGDPVPMPVAPNRWLPYRSAQVMYLDAWSPRSLPFAVREIRALRPDLYYLFGFFAPRFTILPLLLLALRLLPRAPVLLAPHGELGAGALAIKTPKKRAYLAAFAVLRRLVPPIVWHATTALERTDIGATVGLRRRDRLVVWEEANANLPATAAAPVPAPDDGALHIAHISRIAVIKGLDTLLSGLTTVPDPVVLDVYGPLEDPEHWARCQELIGQLPAWVRVDYRGALGPLEVQETFRRYELFGFPTAGESFGHIIGEALSASCPVMINDTTPWSPALRAGGGVVVPTTDDQAWAAALCDYAALPRAERDRRRAAAAAVYAEWRSRPGERDLVDLTLAALP